MQNIKMQMLDVANNEHLNFTYEILKSRAEKNNIELNKKFILPSFAEHVTFLKSKLAKEYKIFYLIYYKQIPFAEIFVNKDMELGVYQSNKNLKLIKSKSRKLRKNNNKILIYDIFYEILRKHKDDIPFLLAKINPENKLSISGTLNLGFKKLYECYIFKNS